MRAWLTMPAMKKSDLRIVLIALAVVVLAPRVLAMVLSFGGAKGA